MFDAGGDKYRIVTIIEIVSTHSRIRSHTMLADLMEEKGMKPSDLWSVLPKNRVSEVLYGKRGIGKGQARQLAELFCVPVELFL